MIYKIVHTTIYTYTKYVELTPHIVRLRPRSDAFQTLQNFAIDVVPEPKGISAIVDLNGNDVLKLWFDEPTKELKIKVSSQVETYCNNPFNYLLEPWAMRLPIADYPAPMLRHLQPYIEGRVDPAAVQLAQEIWQSSRGGVLTFLSDLNQRIYRTCRYTIRETGAAFPPGITWRQQAGSCRDLTVLFMEACRAMGLATRFVSGYQEGDLNNSDRHLHAWAEVYLPGGGWRGYDPTQNLAISDRNIALVSSAIPEYASPINGSFRGRGASSHMKYDLSIEKLC
ncbi:MAG: transglutaminase family protein [Arthrospira platensis PCC 7345]|uniref:transglutaminase family protein n=1 Tax=Limnospira platensis TaxID=118562 RepID=UPI0028E127A1|nr:transglutaminase family protein [Arthrospira platensis PCC 7345]